MIILIPSYEPTIKLLKLVREIVELDRENNHKIVIVDDGSGEIYQGIFDQVKLLGALVLKHETNLGKGAALKTGFKYLLNRNVNEPIVCADSDGQHTVADIIRVGQTVDQDDEMVLGVRAFNGEVPLRSKFGNKVSSKLFGLISGYDLSDTQTGLRAYPPNMLSWLLEVPGDRFVYEFNLLLQVKEVSLKVVTIPIETVYEGTNEGSHFRPIIDSFLVLMPFMKFVLSSFSAGVIDFILLFIFQWMFGNLLVSVVLARIISSTYNYIVNNLYVFKGHNESHKRSAIKYFSLVILIIILNYGMIYTLTTSFLLSTVIAKLVTEAILFIVSFVGQKIFVFYRIEHSESSVKNRVF